MREYVTYTGCRMEYLTRLLDDPAAAPCGRCANDVGKGLPREVSREVVDDARRVPATQPPADRAAQALGRERRARASVIPAPNEDGVALCIYGDPGWGREVERGKHEAGRFSKALVAASVGAIRDRWRPEPAPEWVTSIPTRGRSSIVGDFAAAVAADLGLPYVACLTTVADGQPQRAMQNSVLKLANARSMLVDRRLAGPAWPRAADRRHRRLALDDDGGRVAASRARERPGLPVRPGSGRRGRRLTAGPTCGYVLN